MKSFRNEAGVLLAFHKVRDGYWLVLFNFLTKKATFGPEIEDHVFVLLPVKGYSLEDPQFLQVRIDLTKRSDVLVSIPRDHVRGIVEGKAELPDFSFFKGQAES